MSSILQNEKGIATAIRDFLTVVKIVLLRKEGMGTTKKMEKMKKNEKGDAVEEEKEGKEHV